MATISGRQVNVGLGIESTSGTAVSPTIYPKWTDLSMQTMAEKLMLQAQRGVAINNSASKIQRKFAQGSLAAVANVENAPYFFGLALGSVSSSTASGETSVYDHTITPVADRSSPKTATMVVEEGGTVTNEYTNCVVNSLNLEVSDGWATMTAELIGQDPSTGTTLTESYTDEFEFAYSDMTAKFGSDVSTAEGASATKLQSFSLNINNNVLTDRGFLSGANTIADGKLPLGTLEITGSYTIQYDGTSETDKYANNTEEAMVVQFDGDSVGSGPTTEKIKIDLAKLVLTSAPKEFNLDDLVMVNQEFSVRHDSSDGSITTTVTNEQDGTNY